MSDLPVNVDATYDDDVDDASVKLHQQHHDAIHALYNDVSGATPDLASLGIEEAGAAAAAQTAAEATAANADNLTSGTVADARIASTIARDSEVATAVSDHRAEADATAHPSIDSRLAAVESGTSAPATVSGTTDTLTAADADTFIRYTNAALVTVTIPTDASGDLADGFEVVLYAEGAGGVTLSTTGITLTGSSPNTSIAQNEALFLKKTATANTWIVVGGTA